MQKKAQQPTAAGPGFGEALGTDLSALWQRLVGRGDPRVTQAMKDVRKLKREIAAAEKREETERGVAKREFRRPWQAAPNISMRPLMAGAGGYLGARQLGQTMGIHPSIVRAARSNPEFLRLMQQSGLLARPGTAATMPQVSIENLLQRPGAAIGRAFGGRPVPSRPMRWLGQTRAGRMLGLAPGGRATRAMRRVLNLLQPEAILGPPSGETRVTAPEVAGARRQLREIAPESRQLVRERIERFGAPKTRMGRLRTSPRFRGALGGAGLAAGLAYGVPWAGRTLRDYLFGGGAAAAGAGRRAEKYREAAQERQISLKNLDERLRAIKAEQGR
jgi:hypothetical protein